MMGVHALSLDQRGQALILVEGEAKRLPIDGEIISSAKGVDFR